MTLRRVRLPLRFLLLGVAVAIVLLDAAQGGHDAAPVVAAVPDDEAARERVEAKNVRQRQRWFNRQRTFGGGMRRRVMAKSVDQSEALVVPAMLDDPAANLMWNELGPRATESRAPGVPSAWSEYGGFGPMAGRVTSIVPHPTNTNIAYIGTANGGVWKTTDGGTSWNPITDGQLASLAIGAVALDPSDAAVVYAGTGEGNGSNYYGAGLYRSTNAGGTWQQLGGTTFDGCTFAGIAVKPGSPNTILAAVQGSWGLAPPYAASGWCNNRGVWRSTDGGATWTRVLQGSSGAAWDIHVAPNNPNVWFATIGWDGIYRSNASGALGTWTKLTSGLPAGAGRVELDVAAATGSTTQTLYAAFSNNSTVAMYKSTDGGATWAGLAPPRSAQTNYGFCGSGQCNYDLVVEIDPRNLNRVFVGGVWLNRYDYGTPSVIAYRTAHSDFHALAMDSAGRLWVGSDGGVYRSPDGGITYTNLNADLGLTQFYPGISGSLGSRLIGGTQDNGTSWYSGSSAWSLVEVADGAYSAANRTTALPAYVSRYNLLIFKINNSTGQPCSNLETTGMDRTGAPFIAPMVMHPTNSSIVYAGSRTLWRTTNANQTACGATTWSSYATGFDADISAIGPAPSDTGVVYTGLENGRVYVRRSGGAWSGDTFAGITEKRWITDFAVSPTNANVAYVARSGFGAAHVYKTTDAGASWQNISGNLPNTPVNALLLDSRTSTLYAGTDIGVFWTQDGGVTWRDTSIDLPRVVISDLLLDTTANRLVAATYGRGMWRAVPVGFAANTPSNDGFGGAAQVAALPFTKTGVDTQNATETGEPQPSCTDGIGKTLWYRYQPVASHQATVDLGGSNFDTVAAVWRGTAQNALTQVGCNDDFYGQGMASKATFTAEAGQTYYIQVGGWKDASNAPAYGALSIAVSSQGPANDTFDGAATVTTPLPFQVSNVPTAAATDAGEPQPSTACATGIGKTLWYRYQPTGTHQATADTQGSGFDTVAVVYRGTTLAGLTQVACDDDALGSGGASRATFTAEAGQTYYIQVGGWKNSTTVPGSGSLSFKVATAGLANDAFEQPTQINSPPFAQSGISTATATTQTDEPQPSVACASGVGKTVWYRYAPAGTEPLVFSTQNSNFDTVVVVYRGTSLGGLTQVACNDDYYGSGGASRAAFTAEAGQTYYIQVGGWKSDTHAPASGSLNVGLAAP
jgi:hypothetical protein